MSLFTKQKQTHRPHRHGKQSQLPKEKGVMGEINWEFEIN